MAAETVAWKTIPSYLAKTDEDRFVTSLQTQVALYETSRVRQGNRSISCTAAETMAQKTISSYLAKTDEHRFNKSPNPSRFIRN